MIWYGVLALVFGIALPTFLYIIYRMLRGTTSRDWIYNPSPQGLKSYEASLDRMGEEQVIALYQRRRTRYWKFRLLARAGRLLFFLSGTWKEYAWGTNLAPCGFAVALIGSAVASFALRCPVCGKFPSKAGFLTVLGLEPT